jgi:hypothetical protein
MAQPPGLRNPAIRLGGAFVGQAGKQARTERRAMIALAAIFALLVQALAPAFAVAGPLPEGGGVICTDMGVQATPDPSAPPAVDHACKHCVCPAPADTPPAPVQVVRVAYVETTTPVAETPRGLRPPVRAPPRPPGQGPPQPNA